MTPQLPRGAGTVFQVTFFDGHNLNPPSWAIMTDMDWSMPDIDWLIWTGSKDGYLAHDVLDTEFDTFEVPPPTGWPDDVCAAVATYQLLKGTDQ